MDPVNYKGYTIKIVQDSDPESPREWDNLGVMVCFHGRYTLGDKVDFKASDFNSWEELEAYIIKEYAPVAILPIYMIDHGGCSISTQPFNDPWDSGQIGFIYVPRKKAHDNYGCKRVSPKLKNRIVEILLSEVSTYNAYIMGMVYGYQITEPDGSEGDSCYRFIDGYRGDEYALKEAKSVVDYQIEHPVERTA